MEFLDYNGGNCIYNGLTCFHKKIDSSTKQKIKNKLKVDLEGYPTVIPKVLGSPTFKEDAYPSRNGTNNIQNRVKDLQLGEVCKDMTNAEVLDFFKKREEMEGGDAAKILGIPEGDPMFIFCMIQGRTRPLRSFMDGGCSSWLAKNGVPENELKSIKLKQGPLKMFVAGGHTQYADAEWASQLPLSNGHTQIVRGLSVENVTGPMGNIDMAPILEEIRKEAIKSKSPNAKQIANLKVPSEISGEIDMLIGIQYSGVFPQPIFTISSGLTLFKSQFMPHREGEVACVGGPSKALAAMVSQFGATQVVSMFVRMAENPNAFYSNIERTLRNKEEERLALKFNSMEADIASIIDEMVPSEFDEDGDETDIDSNPESSSVPMKVGHSCQIHECGVKTFNSIETDVKRYLDLDEIGLKMEYRCPKCRSCPDCNKGDQFERISIKQEEEQKMIDESIWIDEETGRAIAKLPFRVDPQCYLTNNRGPSLKMLEKICKKYQGDPVVVRLIKAAFEKLTNRGHLVFWEDIPEEEKMILRRAAVSYYIPWDIAFSGSISTPYF